MVIIYKIGNLLEADESIILHGCNAQGVMGSGVAKAIRAKWPQVYADYKSISDRIGLTLGDIYPVHIDDRIVINAITQENYGRQNIQYVDYDAISSVFKKLEEMYPGQSVALPKIGTGLGGGNWNIIETIITDQCKTIQPVVYVLEGE